MSFKDLPLKISYETGKDDLVWDFYIPALSVAKRYDRITGFFSSTSLALSAQGIAALIKKGGKMRLVTCPRLSSNDVTVIKEAVQAIENPLSDILMKEISDVKEGFEKDHVAALGWMLERGYLEMKIALLYQGNRLLTYEEALESPIMHQKVGILYDEEFNGLSFSGSNNESASGWVENIEEFKTFCDWIPGQEGYFKSDRDKFEEFWSGHRVGVKVVDLPTAVKDEIIKAGSDFTVERIALEKYKHYKLGSSNKTKDPLRLFYYQKNARNAWIENNRCLLLQMATGTGKTRTAIGCMDDTIRNCNKTHLVIVISCPENTLLKQWKKDIDGLDVDVAGDIICDGTSPGWKARLKTELIKVNTGNEKNLVVYTTHQTCRSPDFINILLQYSNRSVRFFIGDEAHGLGSTETKNGLLPEYDYRLGLSATPSRWFDDEGTKLLENYFGNKTFEFSIRDALTEINPLTNKHFLVNFYYYPHFIHLTPDETEHYKALSDKISKMQWMNSESVSQALQFIMFERANIEKSAVNKYQELRGILKRIKNSGKAIKDTIIFVSPEQIDQVMLMMKEEGIFARRYTKDLATTPSSKYGGLSEREYVLKHFAEGTYQVLVAIKCLDEGIDVPSAQRAIVMASSTNPREYVQRVGRVIRQAPGKGPAEIHDLIIAPNLSSDCDENLRKIERKIFEKEIVRVKELNENALNYVDAIDSIYSILRKLL